MMHTKILSKAIIVILITALIFTTSCNTSKRYSLSEGNEYSLSIIDPLSTDELNWSNNISFKIIKLENMSDSEIQKVANTSITQAMTAWISGSILGASSVNLHVHCHNGEYLSFQNSLAYRARRLDYIEDYVTVDMKTGKRVMLNDLVRIDEEFVKYIQKYNVIQPSTNSLRYGEPEYLWEYINSMPGEELLKELEACSDTQEQVIENGYFSIEDSIEALIFRNSFYLQPGKLTIVLKNESHITIDTDDIEDFLRVEKW